MTFEEAYRRLPMNGVGELKIFWEVPREADVDDVAAARRSLVHSYWLNQAIDWAPVAPLARYLFTEKYNEQVLAGWESWTPTDDPTVGPIWVKFMGVEELGADRSRVTFCTDIGWWLPASETKPRTWRSPAQLESFIMENVVTGDGERRWLADQHWTPDGDREAKYGAQCTKWAKHKP